MLSWAVLSQLIFTGFLFFLSFGLNAQLDGVKVIVNENTTSKQFVYLNYPNLFRIIRSKGDTAEYVLESKGNRVSRQMLGTDYFDKDVFPAAKLELKLREELKTSRLPPSHGSLEKEKSSPATAAECERARIGGDDTTGLSFDDAGAVVIDHVAVARAAGLFVGAVVEAKKASQGIKKGARGTIKNVAEWIAVAWLPGSLADESDKEASMPSSTIAQKPSSTGATRAKAKQN